MIIQYVIKNDQNDTYLINSSSENTFFGFSFDVSNAKIFNSLKDANDFNKLLQPFFFKTTVYKQEVNMVVHTELKVKSTDINELQQTIDTLNDYIDELESNLSKKEKECEALNEVLNLIYNNIKNKVNI